MSMTAERAEEKEAAPKTLPPITFHELVMSLFRQNEHPQPKEKPAKKRRRHSVKHQ